METWTVVIDLAFHREFLSTDKEKQIEFEAFQRKLRRGGPATIGWEPPDLNIPRWEQLREPYVRDFWFIFGAELIRVPLEILPGSTIRVWHPDSLRDREAE